MENKHLLIIREVLNAWRSKARQNVVPDELTQELFHELSFHPSHKQISEMLQTARKVARKSNASSGQPCGLTFGQFSVLAADLKRFRASKFAQKPGSDGPQTPAAATDEPDGVTMRHKQPSHYGNELRSTKSFSCVEDTKKKAAASEPVEVFLGGSCNPTTWRADVAIPALKELGISFYNPQVSDWTPDLIELEHRAKEKSRVMFFVIDSETRASAGAIEAAHIAGQNCKQLVLVLHPYKPNQTILNEPISQQEYYDLRRNQLILKELVSRRGLPVLDNIPAGLQRTKELLSGIQQPPTKIASILVAVRGAFDRVNPENDELTVAQCRRALLFLGYPHSLITLDNLKKIIVNQREMLKLLQASKNSEKKPLVQHAKPDDSDIDFELFCMISSYLSVLQQETNECGCTSPIKGTNVMPPPVYFTNADSDIYYTALNISRNSSNASVPGSGIELEHQSVVELLSRNRDSGTSSPQPLDSLSKLRNFSASSLSRQRSRPQIMLTADSLEEEQQTRSPVNVSVNVEADVESDSNDSVFSSNSSIASVTNVGAVAVASITDGYCYDSLELRDVYLGGSCVLRTKWRQRLALPYLKSKDISFHLPALHESLNNPVDGEEPPTLSHNWSAAALVRMNLYNPALLDSSRVLLFVISNETRSLAPMTLAAHCIGLMYNVVLAVQMLPDECIIGDDKLTPTAIKDYNRGRTYLIDLAKRQGVPVFTDIQAALDCTAEKIFAMHNRKPQNLN